MLRDAKGFSRIVIACGRTDLRLGIDGLAAIVQEQFQMDPAEKNVLFLFCETRLDYNGPINLDHGIEKMREHGIMRLNEGRSKHHVIQNIHIGVQGEGVH